MIKRILLLTLCVVLSSCQTNSTTHRDSCEGPKSLESIFTTSINDIANMPTPFPEIEVNRLIKPLSKKFDLDHGQCVGYTERVKDTVIKTIKQRSDELKPILHRLCSAMPDDDITDVSLLAAMEETRLAAIEALSILHEQTGACSGPDRRGRY